MIISFQNHKLAKELCDEKILLRRYGPIQGKLIALRLTQIAAAEILSDLKVLPQLRAHELIRDRAGQISVDVKYPYRLLFVPDYEKPPCRDDGGLNWGKVRRIKIIGVEDTHD